SAGWRRRARARLPRAAQREGRPPLARRVLLVDPAPVVDAVEAAVRDRRGQLVDELDLGLDLAAPVVRLDPEQLRHAELLRVPLELGAAVQLGAQQRRPLLQ